jgi:hypothetical protein
MPQLDRVEANALCGCACGMGLNASYLVAENQQDTRAIMRALAKRGKLLKISLDGVPLVGGRSRTRSLDLYDHKIVVHVASYVNEQIWLHIVEVRSPHDRMSRLSTSPPSEYDQSPHTQRN